jgi:hypothetical protein
MRSNNVMLIGFSRYRIGLRTDYVGIRINAHLLYWFRGPRFFRNYYRR